MIPTMTTAYAVRTHGYDSIGHRIFDSEWQSCTDPGSCASTEPLGTSRSNFDPFDREQSIVRSDGSRTDLNYTDGTILFSDTRKTVTVYNVNGTCASTSCSGGSQAATVFVYDAYGRLVKVTEPNGALTNYTYDINGKPTDVSQNGGLQTRAFTYDSFGFLRSETTPEKGPISYDDYGSLGNLKKSTLPQSVPSLTLRTCYDAASRIKEVRSNEDGASPLCSYQTGGPAGRLYVQNRYDEAAGSSAGKLTSRTGNSYSSPSGTLATVTDSLTYSGLGGRLSSEQTAISGAQSLNATQRWSYNNLGLVAHHYHFRAVGQAPAVVSTDYSGGYPVAEYLNGLPVVTGVKYQPSGGLAGYKTGINVLGVQVGTNITTTISQDTQNLLPRPSAISTTGSAPSIGSYTYDGAGNIKQIGNNTFNYDSLSRLSDATLPGLGSQYYCYDVYGNRVSRTTTFPCTPGTWNDNRVPGLGYADGRGNVTTNGGDDFGAGTAEWDYVYNGANERLAKIPVAGGAWTGNGGPMRRSVVRQPRGAMPPMVRGNTTAEDGTEAAACQGGKHGKGDSA